jgi:hypothetical protein
MLRVEDADVTEPALLDRWYTSHSYWVFYSSLLTVVFDGIGSHWMFFIMRFYCTAHPCDFFLYRQSAVLDRLTKPFQFSCVALASPCIENCWPAASSILDQISVQSQVSLYFLSGSDRQPGFYMQRPDKCPCF